MGPPERPQAGRVEALRAKREARKPEREPGLESRAVQGRGIRLERHLARAKHESGAQRVAEARDLLGLEQTRRAAAEEEGAHARMAEELALSHDLTAERLHVAVAERRRGGRGREVAVRATRRAERNVHVKTDPAYHRITPSGLGSSASDESSAVRPRSMSHSRDS